MACCEKEVYDLITSLKGKAEMTDPNLPSGTDRVYAAIQKHPHINQYKSIINLQGDMPFISPSDIGKVNIPLKQGFDIGSLVTNLRHEDLSDINVTKAKVEWIKKKVIGKALDFHKNINALLGNNFYHHVGIYSFKFETLKRFISLPPSNNEEKRQLEQMRALDVSMNIGVAYIKNIPISIDTKEDLLQIENIINKQ